MLHKFSCNFILWKEFKQERIISNISQIIAFTAISILFFRDMDYFQVVIFYLTSYSIILSREIFLKDIGKNYLEAFLACPHTLKKILMEKSKYSMIKSCIFTIISTCIWMIFYPNFNVKNILTCSVLELIILPVFIYYLIKLNGLILYRYSKFINFVSSSLILAAAAFALNNLYKLLLFQLCLILLCIIFSSFEIKNEHLIRG